jgi:glutamate/aspartate transport system substrate-binding protein
MRIHCCYGVVTALLWLHSGALAAGSTSLVAQSSATLTRAASRGVIHVGYIPTPGTFAFKDAAGQTVGYSIDLCHRVIENVRQALGRPDLRIAYRPVTPAERIPLLKSGDIDIECGGNTNTVARQRDVDFSYTFFATGVRLLVKRPLEFQGPSSLWRRKIAATKGTTAADIIQRLKAEQEVELLLVPNDDEGVRLVLAGEVAAFAQDDVLLYGLIGGSPNKELLSVSGNFMTVEPYAFMLPKGDKPLRDIVDKTLRGLMHSGEIVDIYRKWFDSDRIRIPLNVHMKENFKFPNRYGIP